MDGKTFLSWSSFPEFNLSYELCLSLKYIDKIFIFLIFQIWFKNSWVKLGKHCLSMQTVGMEEGK